KVRRRPRRHPPRRLRRMSAGRDTRTSATNAARQAYSMPLTGLPVTESRRESGGGSGELDPRKHPFGDPVAEPAEELIPRGSLQPARGLRHRLAERASAHEGVQEVVRRAPEIEAPDFVALSVDGNPGGLA